jgi:hypothetical protein
VSSKALDIRNQIMTIIQGVQLDGEPAFTEVIGHPRGQFDSEPAVRVLPSDQTSEDTTFGQSDRTVSFIVRTHLKSTDAGEEFDRMYELTDLLIDRLDKADYANELSGFNVFQMETTRGTWFEEDSQAGPILSCDLNVAVKYSKDNA